VIRRLLAEAGIHRSPPKVRSACQRRLATDRRLTERAAWLGFAGLQAYLADHVAERAWTLVQVAAELGIDRNTVSDRLNAYGLRHTKQNGALGTLRDELPRDGPTRHAVPEDSSQHLTPTCRDATRTGPLGG
jgi:hypothetical protein